MKNYEVTMYSVVDGKVEVCIFKTSCKDVATDIWLNPFFRHIIEVKEI